MRVLLLFLVFTGGACETSNQLSYAEENGQLIQTYFDYFNAHDWEKMAALYTEVATFKDPSLGNNPLKMSRSETVAKYSAMSEMIPDLQDSIIATYPSGAEHMIVEFISRGTLPGGSRFSLPICTIFRIEEGKISSDYTYYDNFGE